VTEEQRFATEFAAYVGSDWCVPVDHGSSALQLAFAACGIGPGDEVIVPALTWVACADAVVALGAVPVFVDVDDTLCLDPQLVEQAISPKTKALLCVHLYCSLADLDALATICENANIALIEDCSQAHGAKWKDRKVGSFGKVGVFSMQQGKPLTCGEGGACVTNDAALADGIYRMRTNGRSFSTTRPDSSLEDVGGTFGLNACLSEFHCALLREQLQELDSQLARKNEAVCFLNKKASLTPWAIPIPILRNATQLSPYHWILRLDTSFFGDQPIERIARALSLELGAHVRPTYPPLPEHPLYSPEASVWARVPLYRQHLSSQAKPRLSVARAIHESTLTFHHSMLLAPPAALESIFLALEKLTENSAQLSL
jgi:L-glutamine:2-deoxy-scyllo-inosose/3-amino-2,3-dideoxy-scyllo-inosose aminotransferase